MSFIDTYMKKYRVGDISTGARKNLAKIEKKLDQVTKRGKKGLSFLDAIKDRADEIGDLIERVQQHSDGWKYSFTGLLSSFRFIYSIAIEVYQIVDTMHDEIVPDGITGEKAWEAKKKFAQGLIFFIWQTVGILEKRFRWVPFKKTIEKKLVMWLAGMGMDAARNMFKVNKEVSSFVANNKVVSMKAL